jgi:hypothetical protein
MKYGFAFLFLLACVAQTQASNLNTTTYLTDEGISPPPEALRLVTPNILDGLPLMQGLQLQTDEHTQPGAVIAVGVVDVDDVYAFYKIALPRIGWSPAGPRDYVRGDEYLYINAQADGKKTIVTFAEHKAKNR